MKPDLQDLKSLIKNKDEKILNNLWSAKQLKNIFRGIDNKTNAFGINCSIKNIYNSHGIWGIPCFEAIEDIKKFVKPAKGAPTQPENTILEVMGGTGYLSYWLQIFCNLDVICTDLQMEEDDWKTHSSKQWTFIEQMNASEAVLKYPGRTILASWIPYGGCEDHAETKMLKNMTPGQRLILIGEGYGGCTASDEFFDLLEKDFKYVESGTWVSVLGIHDHLDFYIKMA